MENFGTQKYYFSEFGECTFKPDMSLTKSFNQNELKHLLSTKHTSKLKTKSEITRSLSTELNKSHPRTYQKKKTEKINNNIGEVLYSQRKEHEKLKQKRIEEMEKEIQKEQNSKFLSSKSNQIFNNKKMNCFSSIFTAINSEENGLISNDSINTESNQFS